MPYVERITTVHEDGFSYIIRPNADTEGEATDLALQQDGETQVYICISPECLPEVVSALRERLVHRRAGDAS